MKKEKIVIGENSGAQYIIEKEIGRGGQGRVFSIKGGKYAFKLLGLKSSSTTQLLRRKISYLKTRPIEDLPISKPLEIAKGNWISKDGEAKEIFGYIMEMATDMEPIKSLVNLNGELADWWKNTGGLKKRLIILKKIADTLSKLHSRGLVYGDFSLNNIFVSREKDYSEVFFIDSDNITHESKVGSAVYTPGYAAPELIKTENHDPTSGYDTYTDNFSFAIIAYQLLTLNHPFIGDYVNEGEPELEEKAYLGEIPWINHGTNKINITQKGIPKDLTISIKMTKAFQDTFENGIKNKLKRTTTAQWKEIIEYDINIIIECKCNNHFYFDNTLTCPYCGDKIDFIGFADISPLIRSIKQEIESFYKVSLRQKSIGNLLKRKVLVANIPVVFSEDDFLINSSEKQLFSVTLKENNIVVKGYELKKISIVFPQGKIKKNVEITNGIKINLNSRIGLFLEELNSYQRILIIRKYIA